MQQKKAGPIAGIIIILVVMALGGFYFSKQKLVEKNKQQEVLKNQQDLGTIESSLKEIEASTNTPQDDLELHIQ